MFRRAFAGNVPAWIPGRARAGRMVPPTIGAAASFPFLPRAGAPWLAGRPRTSFPSRLARLVRNDGMVPRRLSAL